MASRSPGPQQFASDDATAGGSGTTYGSTFTRADEHRLTFLREKGGHDSERKGSSSAPRSGSVAVTISPRLTTDETAELAQLERKHEAFIQEGLRVLNDLAASEKNVAGGKRPKKAGPGVGLFRRAAQRLFGGKLRQSPAETEKPLETVSPTSGLTPRLFPLSTIATTSTVGSSGSSVSPRLRFAVLLLGLVCSFLLTSSAVQYLAVERNLSLHGTGATTAPSTVGVGARDDSSGSRAGASQGWAVTATPSGADLRWWGEWGRRYHYYPHGVSYFLAVFGSTLTLVGSGGTAPTRSRWRAASLVAISGLSMLNLLLMAPLVVQLVRSGEPSHWSDWLYPLFMAADAVLVGLTLLICCATYFSGQPA